MRSVRTWIVVVGLAAAVATLAFGGSVSAEDPAAGGPPVQKPVAQAFLEHLVGTWSVDATGGMPGKGKAVFAKGIGGTALMQQYQLDLPGSPFHGHAVHKVSDDGKTMTVWWFDNYISEPIRLAGPLKDAGYEITGEFPGMGSATITLEKTADGLAFRMSADGQELMAATYTRAK
jgi:hypothetical protein